MSPRSLGTKPPRWTTAEAWRLLGYLEAPLSYAEIAIRLGRSIGAVRARCSRLGYSLRNANGQSAYAVARLLGVDEHTVTLWIARGWLDAVTLPIRAGGGRSWERAVSRSSLYRFLAAPRWWHLWQPERIGDCTLREWAQDHRSAAGVEYVGVAAAAWRLHVHQGYVNKLCWRGHFAGAAKHGNNWRIPVASLRLPDVPSRRGRPRNTPLTAEQRAVIAEWYGRVTNREIAQRLGCSETIVGIVATRDLGRPKLGRGSWKGRKGGP